MKPTGWFQVAWSSEIGIGDVQRMKYFGQDMVAWRSANGALTVMDAYCEHLGAHLGYGGRVEGDRIICPFHGWEWNGEGRNVCIPYRDRPNRGRRMRTYPVTERNESVYIWHDIEEREPHFEVPDVFEAFGDGRTADDYYVAYPEGCMLRERRELHPQYMMENGVDFAHFKFVHRAPFVARLAQQDFQRPVARADFEIQFGGTARSKLLASEGPAEAGVQSILAGIGLGLVRFWGPDNMRDVAAVTPVDDETSDVRFTLWLERLPADDALHQPPSLERRLKGANDQFLADVNIWEHQRYAESAALTSDEAPGFRALRKWATQFYTTQEMAIR